MPRRSMHAWSKAFSRSLSKITRSALRAGAQPISPGGSRHMPNCRPTRKRSRRESAKSRPPRRLPHSGRSSSRVPRKRSLGFCCRFIPLSDRLENLPVSQGKDVFHGVSCSSGESDKISQSGRRANRAHQPNPFPRPLSGFWIIRVIPPLQLKRIRTLVRRGKGLVSCQTAMLVVPHWHPPAGCQWILDQIRLAQERPFSTMEDGE